jgi:hypothetical protein
MPLFFGTDYDVLLEVTLDLPSHQLDANAAPVSAPPELHLPWSDSEIRGRYCWGLRAEPAGRDVCAQQGRLN